MNVVSLATRRRLLDAAARIFAERGYAAASIRAIAAAANVNNAAISYHFHGKEELYRAVLHMLDDPSDPADPVMPTGNTSARQQLVTIVWSILMREPLSRPDLKRRILAWEMLRPSGVAIGGGDVPGTELDSALRDLLPEGAEAQAVADAKGWLTALIAVALQRWPAVAGPALGKAGRALAEANRLVALFCDGVVGTGLGAGRPGAEGANGAATPISRHG